MLFLLSFSAAGWRRRKRSFPAISSATPNFSWRARFPYRDTQPRSTFSAGRRERRTDMFSTAVTLRSPTVRR